MNKKIFKLIKNKYFYSFPELLNYELVDTLRRDANWGNKNLNKPEE